MALPVADRIDSLLRRAVEAEVIPGAIVLVRQRDRVVHHGAYGVSDRAGRSPLHPDSVMWLASLTKPLVAAAILMLWEEDKLQLHDPLSRFIPSFAQPRMVRVWRTREGESEGALPAVALTPGGEPPAEPPHDLSPASRELTIFDLLTHTSGLQTITIPNSAVPPTTHSDTLASRVPMLGAVPLDFQPGTRWAYSNAVAYDVLAYIVERVSGLELAAFLQQRLFAPLGMKDTGFAMLGKHPRAVPVDPRFSASPAMAGERYHSGAAGLWGTAADYASFAEMLLNGGQLRGVRILSSRSVEQMTCNQVGELFPGLNGRRRAPGFGFGLSVAVVLDPQRAGTGLPTGSFGWDGVGTRRFWASPESGLVLVMYVPDMKLQAELEDMCGDLARA
jgi:CubicO group peptidase (beta-lactamase class C family)